jgi:hypothetical protein
LKSTILLSFCILFIGLACKKSTSSNIPTCIQKKIDDAKKSPGVGHYQLTEYWYQGKKVYAESIGIADVAILIYDEECNNICVIGGFIITATQLCNGEVFFDKAVKIRDLVTL